MPPTPYLFFDGQCEAAFHFHTQCFGSQIVASIKYGDQGNCESLGPEARDRVMHCYEAWQWHDSGIGLPAGSIRKTTRIRRECGSAECRRSRACFRTTVDKRKRYDADYLDVLADSLRHGDRPVWNPVDDWL